MKRHLPILLLALFAILGAPRAVAQSSMTDDQVMEFIVSETARGTTRSQLMTKLVERGVTVEQVRRVRDKYERMQQSGTTGRRDDTQSASRTRTPNGQAQRGRGGKDSQQTQQPSRRRDAQRQYDSDEERDDDYRDVLSTFAEDSTENWRGRALREPRRDRSREVFGRNIFQRDNLTFEPEMNIATPADYRLGPGDQVFVDIYGASQKNFEATVSPEGVIDLKGYGPVNVAGLTVSGATQRLRNTIGRHYQSSQIRLTVGQTKTISVSVMGEVEMPGTYTLSAFATVFHALYMAGGTTDIGSLRAIKVYRGGRLVTTVDVYDYILNGNLTGNVRLHSEDVIVVGTYESLVQVAGKVKRPMFYEMKPGESVATLLDYAGGLAGDGYADNISLVRKQGGERSIYSLTPYERATFRVLDGDSLYVDSALTRFSNMVEIKGEVRRQGMYQVDGQVSTLRQLIERAGGLTEYAFMGRALVHRHRPDNTVEAISVDLAGLMEHTAPDVPLQNRDLVFIASTRDLQEERTMGIYGEVQMPGTYDFVANTTIEDLIIQAGGLKDAASLVRVDVSRRVRNRTASASGQQISQWYSFELRDGLVADADTAFVLQPFDEVYVRRSPAYIEQEHVSVTGEINFEGSYALTKKEVRLSDLIQMAGGLTPEAFAHGARLERVLTYAEIQKRNTLLKLIVTDSIDVRKLELSDVRTVGIYLDRALAEPGSEWDVVLRNGDRLVIPQYTNIVSTNGEVIYPNSVSYREGASLSYYINQSGGFTQRARKHRVFAVNMNGTVTRVRSAKDIEPGCEIVVPSRAARRGLNTTEILSLGTMGVSLAAVLATVLK
ncbi:MAG: SLBB domain-containing protein [Bacteroidaceae bacterium]|nr:SLBB domain-containing protein [Bacteroidaceae bacterium]